MRLVSALYGGNCHPFNTFGLFNSMTSTSDPDDLKAGDCLVIWGGGDIWPGLYGKQTSKMSHVYGDKMSQRDAIEWALLTRARELGCPIIGVCRGGQMITAAAGGYLIQHLDNHAGYGHDVVTSDNATFSVNTIHHQMMMPGSAVHELVAWSPERLSDRYFDEDSLVDVPQENEFIYYPDMKGFAVQWHPEGMSSNSTANKYLNQFMKDRL